MKFNLFDFMFVLNLILVLLYYNTLTAIAEPNSALVTLMSFKGVHVLVCINFKYSVFYCWWNSRENDSGNLTYS